MKPKEPCDAFGPQVEDKPARMEVRCSHCGYRCDLSLDALKESSREVW